MRWVWLFLFGGIGGAACDQIHVRFGVLTYPSADLLGQPWWVAPLFGAGSVVGGAAAITFARHLPGLVASRRRELIDSALFVLSYLATGLFVEHPVVLLVGLTALWLWRSPRAPLAWVFGLLLAAAGVALESSLISLGLFAYVRPHFLGVPLWLPGLYLAGAPMALDLGRGLQARSTGA